MRFGLLLCIVRLNSVPEGLGLRVTAHVCKLLLCKPSLGWAERVGGAKIAGLGV